VKQRPLLIYGAGGHGLVVAEAARLAGFDVLGFIDDGEAPGVIVGDFAVLGGGGMAGEYDAALIVAIGDNRQRLNVINGLIDGGATITSVIHPDATVSSSARIEVGVFVGPRAVVHSEARLGRGVIVNSGAIVEHHNQLDSAVHIAPGAVLAGRVTIGARALIGAGATVLPDVTIGDDAIVGAGAVVTKNVDAGTTVVGNPAREKA
jgi:sugar O-acyltransferase (sialic acid O-acetyltransferase NeuD family)